MEGEKGGKVIILLLIPILTLLVSREGAEISGAEKGNLIPVSRSRKVVCLHHPQGASCCSGRRGGGESLPLVVESYLRLLTDLRTYGRVGDRVQEEARHSAARCSAG